VDFDAVVLAGGRAARLDGADKAALEVDGEPLLERTLAALAAARRIVVVGDERPTSRPVLWTRESPPYGGPVAAAYAGVDALRGGSPVQFGCQTAQTTTQTHGSTPPPGLVLVLAVDMPEVTGETVGRLVEGAAGHEGAVLVEGGRRHLAFAVQAQVLDGVRPGSTDGAAMRDLWSALDLADVAARGGEAHDVDRWTDLTPRG
jgi:molybdopterin-guanine dinucleotide biosynthesis protein A